MGFSQGQKLGFKPVFHPALNWFSYWVLLSSFDRVEYRVFNLVFTKTLYRVFNPCFMLGFPLGFKSGVILHPTTGF